MTGDRSWLVMRAANTQEIRGTSGVSRVFFTRDEIGSEQLMTGITTFEPGAALFWHVHTVDESITVLEGEPMVEIGGAGKPIESVRVHPLDTVFVPAYTPHRFCNPSQTSRARILFCYPTGRIERYRVDPDGTQPDFLGPDEPRLPAGQGHKTSGVS